MYLIEELEDVPVVKVSNLLPDWFIDELYGLLGELEGQFATPNWASGKDRPMVNKRTSMSLCSAKDMWFPATIASKKSPAGQPWVPALMYELLERFIFHQGILDFLSRSSQDVFRLIPEQSHDGRMHIVSYGDKDYYNWHRDHTMPDGAFMYGKSPARKVLFTFNLCLCKNDQMIGGDGLYMKDNKTIAAPFEHNAMYIFPATVSHAASAIKMNSKDTWLNRRFSCQFWMAGTQVITAEEQENSRWTGPVSK